MSPDRGELFWKRESCGANLSLIAEATVPEGARSGPLTVTTPGGVSVTEGQFIVE